MKSLPLTIYSVLIAICTILGAVFAFTSSLGLAKGIIFTIVLIIIVLIVCTIMYSIIGKRWSAYINQKKIGCFKGLWADEGLAAELERDFKDADNIRIKVTRGTELFETDNKGQISKYLEKLIDRASNAHEIRCNFLLIAPCYQIKHVRERHNNHKEQYKNPEDFLKTWYDTLDALKKIGHGKSNIYLHTEVRFYSGRHSKWRFYIFESNGNKNTVLFSDYDAEKSKHGSSLPMYKVLKNDKNIGGFMERYFDEMWSTALTKEDFKKLVESGNCKRRFCEVCDNANNNCTLSDCPNASDFCPYKEKCNEYVRNM